MSYQTEVVMTGGEAGRQAGRSSDRSSRTHGQQQQSMLASTRRQPCLFSPSSCAHLVLLCAPPSLRLCSLTASRFRKQIPKYEVKYVERFVEVPEYQYVDRYEEVEEVETVYREVPKKVVVPVGTSAQPSSVFSLLTHACMHACPVDTHPCPRAAAAPTDRQR
eukprot:GHVU01195444.1.p1 GENE.GHVU01195444.1~~GHVU01195444.1.p1  ORF type:complete len:163 (+),score=25.59 GHVU01195444.1:217-705(+)